jgi:hypothetical protein
MYRGFAVGCVMRELSPLPTSVLHYQVDVLTHDASRPRFAFAAAGRVISKGPNGEPEEAVAATTVDFRVTSVAQIVPILPLLTAL